MAGLSVGRATLLAVALALLLGALLQTLNVRSFDDPAALLRVGADSTLREIVEEELGPVPLTAGNGHDGQFFFVAARDPMAIDAARTNVYEVYRHRRIAYPVVAGLGGLLSAEATLAGLAVVPVLGMALAAGAAVALVRPDRREVALAAVLANPGIWLSVSLATGDALALGAGLGAMPLLRRGRLPAAVALLTFGVFAKETNLIFVAAAVLWLVTVGRWRAAVITAAVPSVLFLGWVAWLESRLPTDGLGLWNLDWPVIGLVRAAPAWSGTGIGLIAFTLAGIVAAAYAIARTESWLMRLTLIPWLGVALIGSEIVWREPNNAIRVMSPLLTLGVLALIITPDRADQPDSTSRKNLPV